MRAKPTAFGRATLPHDWAMALAWHFPLTSITTTILAVMYAISIRALSRPLPVTNAMLDRVARRVESDAVMALLLGVIAVVTLTSMLWALVCSPTPAARRRAADSGNSRPGGR